MLCGSQVFPLDCAAAFEGSSCIADFFTVLLLMALLPGLVAAQSASPTCTRVEIEVPAKQ
jgi:hypothetical protein